MSLSSFFLWHLYDVRARLAALEQALSRQRMAREREAERARWFAQVGQERW
jgi:hypothetical protein